VLSVVSNLKTGVVSGLFPRPLSQIPQRFILVSD
jgi:hypothetical protein